MRYTFMADLDTKNPYLIAALGCVFVFVLSPLITARWWSSQSCHTSLGSVSWYDRLCVLLNRQFEAVVFSFVVLFSVWTHFLLLKFFSVEKNNFILNILTKLGIPSSSQSTGRVCVQVTAHTCRRLLPSLATFCLSFILFSFNFSWFTFSNAHSCKLSYGDVWKLSSARKLGDQFLLSMVVDMFWLNAEEMERGGGERNSK